MNRFRQALRLSLPFWLLPALYIPYSWLNSTVIVNWLGCGCPVMDDAGNAVYRAFNANDFTSWFWGGIALTVIGLSAYLSRRLPAVWMRLLYVFGMAAVSLMTAWTFYHSMMWK